LKDKHDCPGNYIKTISHTWPMKMLVSSNIGGECKSVKSQDSEHAHIKHSYITDSTSMYRLIV